MNRVGKLFLNFLFLFFVMEASTTLLQVHMIMRHGARTPVKYADYPTDPYKDKSYYPLGNGDLTNYGKKQLVDLGRYLRERYQNILGDLFVIGSVDVQTTEVIRTQTSALSLLAGLYEPTPIEQFDDDINWQPVPYHFLPLKQDKLIMSPMANCINQNTDYQFAAMNLDSIKQILAFKDDINYIKKHSGLKVITTLRALALYTTLEAEENFNLTLPDWTKEVYPEKLAEICSLEYIFQTYTDRMKARSSGNLLHKIISDSSAMANGKNDHKMYIYAGHESTVAHMLRALNVFYPHVPKFASHILFEVHREQNKVGFKIYHQNFSTVDPHLLTIPGCRSFCPINEFKKIVSHLIMPNNTAC